MVKKQVLAPKALPKAFGVWSPAILCEGGQKMLFISGLTSRDPAGNVVGEGDYAAQTRQICENLKATMEEAGGTLADIVAVTVYACDVDKDKFDAIHGVRREYFPKDPPTSTMVQITRLVDKRCLIEINAIAVL